MSLAGILLAALLPGQAAKSGEVTPAETKAAMQVQRLLAAHDEWVRSHPGDKFLARMEKELNAALAAAWRRSFDAALEAKALLRAESALQQLTALKAPQLFKPLSTLLTAAETAKNNELCARLLLNSDAIEATPEQRVRLRSAQEQLGLREAFLFRAPGHELLAWVSLPAAWKRGRKDIPVLVAVEGAGSNFLGACRHFREVRAAKDAMLVVPCTFSNTNALNPQAYPFYSAELLKAHEERGPGRAEFDGAGLQAVMTALRHEWGAAERFTMTGFSGGGILTYWWLLQRPTTLERAVLACANFGGVGLQGAAPCSGAGPDIHLLTGEKDGFNDEVYGQKPGILGQTDAAEAALRQLGYQRVTRRSVSGAGHSSLAAEVWSFFR